MIKTIAQSKADVGELPGGHGWVDLPSGAAVLFAEGLPVCMSDGGHFRLSGSDIEKEASELTGETVRAVGEWLKCRLSSEMVAEIDQHLLKSREEAA